MPRPRRTTLMTKMMKAMIKPKTIRRRTLRVSNIIRRTMKIWLMARQQRQQI